jgi:hypothetical protein
MHTSSDDREIGEQQKFQRLLRNASPMSALLKNLPCRERESTKSCE